MVDEDSGLVPFEEPRAFGKRIRERMHHDFIRLGAGDRCDGREHRPRGAEQPDGPEGLARSGA